MDKTLRFSIIIPTLGRGDVLEKCLTSVRDSAKHAGVKAEDYEIILVTEEGELAKLRNKGAKKARGRWLIFLDDDVEVTYPWLRFLIKGMQVTGAVGVSGPTIIREPYRRQRDLFRFKWAKKIYDLLFLGEEGNFPGRITKAGTFSTKACEEGVKYKGEVDYLEACNMAFRADAFWKVGGFDEQYGGIGDWSEPDLSFRIKAHGFLWFRPEAKLYHNCSRSGAFSKRKRTGHRLKNYWLFAKRWVKPHWRHTLFKWFIRTYYGMKDMGIIR